MTPSNVRVCMGSNVDATPLHATGGKATTSHYTTRMHPHGCGEWHCPVCGRQYVYNVGFVGT